MARSSPAMSMPACPKQLRGTDGGIIPPKAYFNYLKSITYQIIMVPAERIELPTYRLQIGCSTAELCGRHYALYCHCEEGLSPTRQSIWH